MTKIGQQIEWTIPDTTEVDYDYTYVYRSATEGGSYSNITNVVISDNAYFDIDGGDTSWYKIRFYKSGTAEWSSYSEVMKGSTFLHYCSVNDVRDLTNLNTTDITDTEIYKLIKHAMYQLNADINTFEVRERLDYIDETRENKVDGSNTTYYVKNWKGKYIADKDNDGDVDTNDITIYAVDSDGTETAATVSSITPNDGKFVLNTAYASSYDLYINYYWSYVSESDPHPLVTSAAAHLAAALSFEKVNTGKSPRVVFGNVRLERDMKASNKFYQKYFQLVERINNRALEYGEAEVI